MKQVQSYIRKHHDHMLHIFTKMGQQDELQATKVFLYLQQVFQLEDCVFQYQGKNYFRNDDNATHMESLLQLFWKNINPQQKFFMYRVRFCFQEIGELIQFWIKSQNKLSQSAGRLKVHYAGILDQEDQDQQTITQLDLATTSNHLKQYEENYPKSKTDHHQSQEKFQQPSKQFLVEPNNLQNQTKFLRQYQRQIQNLRQQLQNSQQTLSIQQRKQKQQLLKQLSTKIETVNDGLQPNSSEPSSPKKSSFSDRSSLKLISLPPNYRQIFDFYAKQTHHIGIQVTFGRIQHQSQTINYQKLVHFLREYELLPSSPRTQKSIHHLYIRCCSSTRDLNFQGFVRLLSQLPEIVIEEGKDYNEKEKIMERIILEKTKDKIRKNKLLLKPFHALQKEDFRIDQESLRYQFRIRPDRNRSQSQILQQLQLRRHNKQLQKKRIQKHRNQKHMRFLKKLQSIDPYDQRLQNNPILQQNQKLPVASLQNIEKFRDNTLDLGKLFGINDIQTDFMKDLSSSMMPVGDSMSILSSLGSMDSGINEKGHVKMPRGDVQRIKSLMNGIIEKSNGQMERFVGDRSGYLPPLSPTKSPRK